MTESSGSDIGPSTQAIPVQPEATGWILGGRYRVLDRIGAGGMADVFRARDDLLDRDVAVKVFRAPMEEPGSSGTDRRELELRALAQLSHPHLIMLLDGSLAERQQAYLVMELVHGPNLAARLRGGPLPEHEVRLIGEQIAEALAYVHARGMVHRDVKPANILLGTDGPTPEAQGLRARLSDFGIVRMVDSGRVTGMAFTLGTASYLSPEQARGLDVDAAADVYSLGLVLIEALTGVRSFDGPVHEAVAARLVRAPAVPATLPHPWPALLAAMTAMDPTLRPTAAEVAHILRGAAPVTSTVLGVVPLAAPLADPTSETSLVAPVTGTVPAAAGAMAAGAMVGGGVGAMSGPAAAAASGPVPPVSDDDLRSSRRRYGMLVAALMFLAVIGVGGMLLLRPTSQNAPASVPTTSPHQSRSAVSHTTGGRSSSSGPQAVVQQTGTHRTSAPPTASRTHSNSPSASSSAAPSRSATPTRSSSSASAPSRSTSSAPTSSAPTTSAAPSSTPTTSSPTSSAATTSSAGTSTSTSTSAAGNTAGASTAATSSAP